MCNLAVHLKFQDLISYATCIISNAIIPPYFRSSFGIVRLGVIKFVINNDEQTKKRRRSTVYALGYHCSFGDGFCVGVGENCR